ncbi:MAG: TRAP transporter substrate-binding protein DctP [Cyanobacteria bacterium NC_groundwater_1444_Ag_S-0.65um_54_12]|nr:TRAP transporter substrate-binding protein DctP [Cyanobacteria bacterium NC_groundwater_1444_Ag_S-0.65um_54_12]
MKTRYSLILALVIGMVMALPAWAAQTLKIAFLAPPGSKWDRILQKMSQEVASKTNNSLRLRFIGGGVMGDEPDEVRKMRAGQLHGAALTGMGLGLIEREARVLELPLLYEDDADVDRATSRVEGYLTKKFEHAGYILLGWAEVGPVYLFTNKPIRAKNDMQGVKMWMWEGDRLAEAVFKELGVVPTPLAITGVLTALQTSMIDGVYNSPQGLLALQWNSKIKYMLNLRLTQSIGALLVTSKAWGRLSADEQKILKAAGETYCRQVVTEGRKDNARAWSALRQQGVEVTEISTAERKKIREAADKVADRLADDLYPRTLLKEVRAGVGR